MGGFRALALVGVACALASSARADTPAVGGNDPAHVQTVSPSYFRRATAGAIPAFERTRIARFLAASHWKPVFKASSGGMHVTPGVGMTDDRVLIFVHKKPTHETTAARHVVVGGIEQREGRFWVDVDGAPFALLECEKRVACLVPKSSVASTPVITAAPSTASPSSANKVPF